MLTFQNGVQDVGHASKIAYGIVSIPPYVVDCITFEFIRDGPGIVIIEGLLPFSHNAGNLLALGCAAGTGGRGNQEDKYCR